MKKILIMGMAVLGILLCTACGETAVDNKTTAVDKTTAAVTTVADKTTIAETVKTRVITDMQGNQITVPAEVKKIATCVTVGTQTVLMLGGADNVATLGQGFNYAEGSFLKKMYPGLDDIPGMTRNDAANAEAVAKINPDVLLIDVPDTASALNKIGIPALVQRINNTDELKTTVRLIAELLGGDSIAEGEAWCKYYDGVIASVKDKTKDIKDDDKPMVWFARGVVNSAGLNSIPHDWVTAAGGKNMASELDIEGSRVELVKEDILKMNPEIIICVDRKVKDAILAEEAYKALSAVQTGKVYVNPIGAGTWDMASAENALQWYWAPSVIQPELFADTDMDAIVRAFYNEFYEYELSDDEVNTILMK